jgi:ankyrin repeat protein
MIFITVFQEGSTSLIWASRGGHDDVVNLLIDNGMNINFVNDAENVYMMIKSQLI